MSTEMRDALDKVAAQMETDAVVLLREAARAIIECHAQHGVVPKDMAIVQRQVLPLAMAAEDPPVEETARRTGTKR